MKKKRSDIKNKLCFQRTVKKTGKWRGKKI